MSTIYDEALLDAKKIRDAAEQAAREKIMETITPQIRDLINKRILFEESEDLSPEGEGDEEGFDVDSYVESLPDVDDETQEIASQKAATNAATVTIHAKGDVNIDMDDDDDTKIEMAENFKRLLKNELTSKGPLFSRVLKLSENVRKLNGLSKIVNESKLTKNQREVINRSFAECFNEAVELSTLLKQRRGSQRLEEKLRIAIKEMREMSSKYGSNIFDFLFEAEDADKKKEEGKKSKETETETYMHEADEDDDTGTEDEGDEGVDVDAAKSALESLAAALGIEMGGSSEEPGEEEEAGEEEEGEEEEGEGEEMDEGYYEAASHDGGDDLDEGDWPFSKKEGQWSMGEVDKKGKKGEVHHPKMEAHKGKKGEEKEDLDEIAPTPSPEEGAVYEIDEAALRRELSRLRESRRARTSRLSESHGRTFDVDPATLTRIIAEEVAAAKGRRLSESSRRPVRQAAPQVNEVAEYKKAVGQLKQQLVEMNLFNAKLLYANKLLQNKNLSVKQQRAIVEALDNAKTLGEAKLLYRSLSESLSRRGQGGKVVSESVNRTLGSSSRSTRSGSPTSNGVETDRWAVLAGISKN